MRIFIIGLLFTVLPLSAATASPASDHPVTISVRVVDEQGAAIQRASITINESQGNADTNGLAQTRTPSARLYTIRIAGPGYYPMLQTYSEQERQQFKGQLPQVTLVKQIPGRVLLAFAGDAMLGRRYHAPNPGDPLLLDESSRLPDSKALLKSIKPYLELADYTSINLESPVLAEQPPEKSAKSITFFSYPEILAALRWAGVDHVSLGNNHSYDYLEPALEETLQRLSDSQLGYSGAGMNEAQALLPHRTTIGATDYSFFGYVGWAGKVQPSQVAEGRTKGGAALGTSANIVSSVSAEPAGRVAVVEYHGSKEYSFQPTDTTRQRLRTAIDHGADIVIGHHPHVLHGFEVYKGKLIAWSLGNFLFDQYIYETQRSALLYVWMDGDTFHRAEIVPLYIKTYRPTPAVGGMREYVLRRITEQSALEELELQFSGGHAVVAPTGAAQARTTAVATVVGTGSEQLLETRGWHERFESVSFSQDGASYRVGRDWWSLGDNEQEQQFQLLDRNWHWPNGRSGISDERALENYAMKLMLPAGKTTASVGQQYFMRVWDEKPKTVSLQVYSEGDIAIRACLELRGNSMSTAAARQNPMVRCFKPVELTAGSWQPVQFDFSPPARSDYRGLRIRFDVLPNSDEGHAVYLDDLKFISWEKSGAAAAADTLSLSEDRRWNVLGITCAQVARECGQLTTSRY